MYVKQLADFDPLLVQDTTPQTPVPNEDDTVF